MLKKPSFAISVLHIYIFFYIIILQVNVSNILEHAMFIAAPFVAMWMFYTVILHAERNPDKKKQLWGDNKEFDLF